MEFNNARDEPWASWPEAEVPENVHRHPMAMPGTLGRFGLTEQEVDDIVAFLETADRRLRAVTAHRLIQSREAAGAPAASPSSAGPGGSASANGR